MRSGKKKDARLKSARFHWLLTLLGLGALLGATLYVVFRWDTIPEEIPTHFNAAGEIDATGQKRSLLIPLVIGWTVYGLLSLVEAIPAVWNVGIEVAPENREAVLRSTRTMLALLKLELALWFAYLIIWSAQCQRLSVFALALWLAFLFSTILWGAVKAFRGRSR